MAVPRRVALKRPEEFQRCYKQGTVWKNRYAVVHVYDRRDEEGPRFGVAVSRRIGNAVVRNRLKRWLREALRPLIRDVSPGVDVVVSARSGALDAGFWRLKGAVHDLMRKSGVYHERNEGEP